MENVTATGQGRKRGGGRLSAMGVVIAALLVGAHAEAVRAEPLDRIRLVIFNRATEGVHLVVQESRCLDGSAVFNGRLVLIERPRISASLRLMTDGECAAAGSVRLRISLIDFVGGTVGTLALDGSDAGIVLSAVGEKRVNACAQTARTGPASAPVFTARFRPCDS